MDYRKIIEFGKSSYVVSLPKDWLKKNNLKKGDVLYLDKEDEKINLYPSQRYKVKTSKSAELDITGLDVVQIKMLLISRYIRNYNEIIITAKDLKDKAKDVRDIIHDLIALEIMEETSDKIIAKDFLNLDEIDILDTMQKMDKITRDMMKDSHNSFDEENYSDLSLRDKDVNRLLYVTSRAIRHLQRRPAFAKEKGYSQGELMRLWNIAAKIESVADNVKRVAKMLNRVKVSDTEKKELITLYKKVLEYYTETLDAYFEKDQQKSVVLRPKANKLTKQCKDYFRANWDVDWVPTILEKLKAIVADTKAMTQSLCDMA